MRALRGVFVLLVLTLAAVACGSDAGGQTGPAGRPGGNEAAGSLASATVKPDDLCKTEYGNVKAPQGLRVGLVTDLGQVDDGTFNQFAFEGMKAAERCFNIKTSFIETTSQADYARNLDEALRERPDVVITVGFLLGTDTLRFAQTHPETKFIGVDQLQERYPSNYVGVLFREDESGFIAGAMAGLLTRSGAVAVIGGRQDVPSVVRFVNGFAQGAKYVNPSIDVRHVYTDSFTDQAKGVSAAKQFLGEGADVIFGAGGQTGSGGIKAAAADGAWVIGVDQDEYFTTFSKGKAPGADRLATSAMKRVDLGVFTEIAKAVTGQFTSGAFVGDAGNGGVTYAPFHDAKIPGDVAKRVEEVRKGLADGSIETGIDPATGQIVNQLFILGFTAVRRSGGLSSAIPRRRPPVFRHTV
ncbi:MAG: BMP family lipoprotein [Egibacteraceae bacterium]